MSRKSRREHSGRRAPAVAAEAPHAPQHTDAAIVHRAAAVVGVLTFAVYAATAYPFVAGGDSGELVVVSATLGVAHPPGYPLFTLLGKAFSLLPFGTTAYRVNLLSAAADAVAAGIVLAAVARWSGHLWAGVLAAGLFALSPLVWTYASAAEVFALNNLFVAGLVYLAARFSQTTDTRVALGATLWIGFGLANHHTFAFYAAPFVVWMSWHGRASLLRPKTLVMIAGLTTVGLLSYLYLPLAGARIPLMGWGDPTTPRGLLRHLLREEYGTFQLGTERVVAEGATLRRLLLFLGAIPAELSYVGLPLAVVGLVKSLRGDSRCRALGGFWLAAFAFYALSFAALSNLGLEAPLALTVQARFWQQSMILLCVWSGLGVAFVVRRFALERFAAPVVLLVLLTILLARYRAQDQSGNFVFRDYGRAILSPLPRGAVLLTQGDHVLGALRYLQVVDQYRPDVIVLDQSQLGFDWAPRWAAAHFPDVILPGDGIYSSHGYDMRQFLEANLPRHAVFVINGLLEWDQSLRGAYTLVPAGLAFKLVRIVDGAPDIAVAQVRALNDPVFAALDPKAMEKYAPSTWESLVHRNYWRSYEAYSVELLASAARQVPADQELVKAGLAGLERCTRESRYAEASLYKNLGLGYQLLEPQDAAAVDGTVRAWKQYLDRIPPEHPDAERIGQAVKELEEARR